MKKIAFGLAVFTATVGLGFADVFDVVDKAAAVGEAAGTIAGCAVGSDSWNEFTSCVSDTKYKTETLQNAQKYGKQIGDAAADAYLWATSDD